MLDMFCSNCGAAEQTPDTYCRSCGDFLEHRTTGSRLAFGGRTPQQNLTSINILSLVAAIISIHAGVWMYLTHFNVRFVLYLGAAVLLCNAIWHFSNFVVSTKLERRLKKAKGDLTAEPAQVSAAETRELLPTGTQPDAIPLSITESTTRDLKQKIER